MWWTKNVHRYYQSTMFDCNCGEVAFESSIYKAKMKCSHMLFKCVQKGEKIENNIKYQSEATPIGKAQMNVRLIF